MKIVIATYTYLPNIGGVATTESILAQTFVDLGHDLTVITTETAQEPDNFQYPVLRNPDPLTLLRHYISADILILANLSLKLIWPLLFLRRQFGLRHHSESAWNLPSGIGGYVKKIIRDRGVHFMTSQYCGRQSGLPHIVTYPFTNPHHIRPEIILPHKERKGVLFAGRLEEEKGITYLLDHWPHISNILQEDTLHIIGTGSLEGAVKERLQDKMFEKVQFHGFVPLEQVAEFMGSVAFSIVPSLWCEPFGAVASESLAAGAITVHTDRGGLPETTGHLGHHFDPDSEASLTRALESAAALRRDLLTSSEKERIYKENVADFILRFSSREVAQTIIDTLRPAE